MALTDEHKKQLDVGIRTAFQHALEKYAMPNFLDMPQFQNFAREVVNDLYDSLDEASLPETIKNFKDNNKNKHDSRSTMRNPQQEEKPDYLQQGIDNVPQLADTSPEDLSPPKVHPSNAAAQQSPTDGTTPAPGSQQPPAPGSSESPANAIPLAEPLNVPSQRKPEGEPGQDAVGGSGASVPENSSGSLMQRAMAKQLNSNQPKEPPQRGTITRGVNSLLYRRPLRKIKQQRKALERKQKKLNRQLKNLERIAKPLRVLRFALKRSLNIVSGIMLVFYIIGGIITCTIIFSEVGLPIIGATTSYGRAIRTPLKRYLKTIEQKLEKVEEDIKSTKKILTRIKNRLKKLAYQERKIRNASLIGFGDRSERRNLSRPSPATA